MLSLALILAAAAAPFELSPANTSHLCWFSELDASLWNTTAGNEPGEGDHFGSDYYALDYNTNTFDADCGTIAYPVCAGTVLFAGTTDPGGDPEGPGDNGYGYQVIVQCDDDPEFGFRHSHLQAVSVSAGVHVDVDDEVGLIGNTGNSSACHDHLVLYRNLSMESPDYAGTTGLERLQIGRAPTALSGGPNLFAAPYMLDADCSSPVCEDSDGDGELPLACGGTDCDDTRSEVSASAPEQCDGVDNQCDGPGAGLIDEGCDDVGDPAAQWLAEVNLTHRWGIAAQLPVLAAGDTRTHLVFAAWGGAWGRDLWHAEHNGSDWSPPVALGYDDAWCTRFGLDATPDDAAHLAVPFCSNTGSNTADDYATYLQHTASGWGAPETASPGGHGHQTSIVVVDDVAHMLWYDDLLQEVRTSRREQGQWGPVETLTASRCYESAVAEGPGGTVHGIFECRDTHDMRYGVFDGDWSDLEVIATGTQAASHVGIGVAPDGIVHVTWMQSFSGHRTVHAQRDASGWSAAEVVSGPEVARFPELVVDRHGNAHVVWMGLGSGLPYRVEYRRLEASGWTDIFEIAVPDVWMNELALTVDAWDVLHVMWSAQGTWGRELGYRRTASAFDLDLDGVGDDVDVCPAVYDPAQADGDGDGIGDRCDACPVDPDVGCPHLVGAVDCVTAEAEPGDTVQVGIAIDNVDDVRHDVRVELALQTCAGNEVVIQRGRTSMGPGAARSFVVDIDVPSQVDASNLDCELQWVLRTLQMPGNLEQSVDRCSWELEDPSVVQ